MQELIEELEPFLRRKNGTQKVYKVPHGMIHRVTLALVDAELGEDLSATRDSVIAALRGVPCFRLLVALPCSVGDQALAMLRRIAGAGGTLK